MSGGRWLTPAGRAALAVLQIDRAAWPEGWGLSDRLGISHELPNSGQAVLRRLSVEGRDVDEVVAVGRERCVELHLHGSEALRARLDSSFEGLEAGPSFPVESLRSARALASAWHGPLARLIERVSSGGELEDADRRDLDRVASLVGFGERLLRPARVELVGRPNAGKSTLFNHWVGQQRALVSPRAGTTRDSVTARVLVHGVPLDLLDSAGVLEPSASPSLSRPQVDLRVHVLSEPDESAAPAEVPQLVVLGRCDERLGPCRQGVSGRTGEGFEALERRVAEALGLAQPASADLWTPLLPEHRSWALRATSTAP